MKSEKLRQVVQAYYDQAFGVGRMFVGYVSLVDAFVHVDYMNINGVWEYRRLDYYNLVPFMLERGTFEV